MFERFSLIASPARLNITVSLGTSTQGTRSLIGQALNPLSFGKAKPTTGFAPLARFNHGRDGNIVTGLSMLFKHPLTSALRLLRNKNLITSAFSVGAHGCAPLPTNNLSVLFNPRS